MRDNMICPECRQEMSVLENDVLFCPLCSTTYPQMLNNLMKFENEDADISHYFEDGRALTGFIPKRMADTIKEMFIFKTFRDNDQVLVYDSNDGVYKENGEKIVKEVVRRMLGEKCNIHYVSETIAAVKETTYIDRKLFNTDNSKIIVGNGVLDLDTMELLSHDSKYLFTCKIPVFYNPSAACNTFMEFLEKKVPNECNRKTLQEMFGYCLLKDNRLQKAFLLYGPRRTGKSTMLNVLKAMLGLDNITAMSLQFLNEDNFAMAYIYGKLSNICADLSSRALRDVGKFMMATGQDPITIGRKKEHPFTFDPITKFIFSCNTIPPTSNKDMAFYRRWCLLNFNEQIEECDIDDGMIKKLTSPEELEGVLLWAIEGAKRIINDGRLSYPLDEFQVKDLYERNSDSINSFIFNCIDEDDEMKIKKRAIYKEYEKYCKENKLRVENQILFGRVFKEITGCGIGREGDIPAYVGVKLKDYERVKTVLEEYF